MSLAEPRPFFEIAQPAWHGPRLAAALLTLVLSIGIVGVFALSVTAWTPVALIALPLVTLTAVWISGGAATSVLGVFTRSEPRNLAEASLPAESRTALLVTLCKEDPISLARYLSDLRQGLDHAKLLDATQVFVLSDTSGADLVAREEAAMLPLHTAGILHYRRRARNIGRKPGNIGQWLDDHGDRFDHMLVLDADSRMTPGRIARMIRQMESRPDLGLLQAGIAIRPGTTRFAGHQRTSTRLLSHGFGRGFAAWSGESGTYWGHNAIMRVAAFRAARDLPVLSGEAPWGGTILSHDFVEAAWIRRAGWAVALDPDSEGSAESAPETLDAFHARDRRWCQGNLQHLRILAEPGLHPISRLHLTMGVLSYLVAPIWLALITLVAIWGLPVAGAGPLAVVLGVLLLPKICALIDRWRVARTPRRRAIYLKASVAELVVSSLIAPLVMLRQAAAVFAVAMGRDSGWKTGRGAVTAQAGGLGEVVFGMGLIAVAVLSQGPAAVWLLPVALPLCLAPLIRRVMDAAA
jgi:membrane glycosyltransferase